jgi:transposase
MTAVLSGFAAIVNPLGDKIIVLLLDNAGWHVSRDLVVPEGIHLCFIPPYTPELSPAEPVMPLLREAVANQLLTTLPEVEKRIVDRCVYLQSQPQTVKGACGFKWAM